MNIAGLTMFKRLMTDDSNAGNAFEEAPSATRPDGFVSDILRNFRKADIVVLCQGSVFSSGPLAKAAALCGLIRGLSKKNVQVIFCDDPPVDDINKIKVQLEGYQYGLDIKDMVFTSDLWHTGKTVVEEMPELLSLADVYINLSAPVQSKTAVDEISRYGHLIVLTRASQPFWGPELLTQVYFLKTETDRNATSSENYNPRTVMILAEDARNIIRLLKCDFVSYQSN